MKYANSPRIDTGQMVLSQPGRRGAYTCAKDWVMDKENLAVTVVAAFGQQLVSKKIGETRPQ
jgi:hypothetical protein